jgi:YARHG domain
MKRLAAAACLSLLASAPAMAESCYDLWYARNLIYAENGYCFKTRLGMDTFPEYACETDNPRFTRSEQKQIDAIRREEKRRKCNVN